MPTTRKTRGPRTPDERAGDAAASTATLFEKLPSSHFADTVLKPLAALLRFYNRPVGPQVSLRDVRQVEAAECQFVDFMSREGKFIEHMPLDEGAAVEEVLQDIQRRLRIEKARIATHLTEEAEDDA